MFEYRQPKPCRNGPHCYYLRQGTCWFYHPHQHSNAQLFNFFGSSLQRSQMRQPSLNGLVSDSFSGRQIDRRYQSIQSLLGKIRDLNRQQMWKNQIVQEEIEQQEIMMGGKKIPLVKINPDLDKQKSWFFRNSYHFNHFPQCEFVQCSICISNFQKQQLLSTLLCQHAFHRECIETWLKKSDQCPLCRKDFRVHEKFKRMKGYVTASKAMNVLSYNGIDISDYEDDQEAFQFGGASISVSQQDEQQDIYSLNESYGFDQAEWFDDPEY